MYNFFNSKNVQVFEMELKMLIFFANLWLLELRNVQDFSRKIEIH